MSNETLPELRAARAEVAVFVTRKGSTEVLIVHRSRNHGGYWHVVAGGIEPGETAAEAAVRELHEETGLVAEVATGLEISEYVAVETKEPAERPSVGDVSVARVDVTCFRVAAPDDWEPRLDWEHDDHRWCDVERAVRALRWPATARALRQLVSVERS